MPIPILFIGIAAITGATGIGKITKASIDQVRAKKLSDNSTERMEAAAKRLESLRLQCSNSLQTLGEEKLFVLNGGLSQFLTIFSQIKNVDFRETYGLQELSKLHVDKKEFEELKEMRSFAASLVSGSAAGVTGGALTAFGAWSAASMFAAASTGTAISTLSGAAATNATLAFFGGGSMAAGGLGMAGGAAVLGGLVAGPALLVMGIITGAKAGKNLEIAKAGAAEADVICEQFETGAEQCIAIRRRAWMFYNALARLDARFVPAVYKLDDVLKKEGFDYSLYSEDAKKCVAVAASLAVSIKAILDTPLLTVDGNLTEESQQLFGLLPN